jgi:AbrB family looped-hinge helix DNA binding protein
VTIPLEIRERYDLKEGDEVEFIAEEKGSYIVPLKRRDLMELYGSIKVTKPSVSIATARAIARKRRGQQLDQKAKRA